MPTAVGTARSGFVRAHSMPTVGSTAPSTFHQGRSMRIGAAMPLNGSPQAQFMPTVDSTALNGSQQDPATSRVARTPPSGRAEYCALSTKLYALLLVAALGAVVVMARDRITRQQGDLTVLVTNESVIRTLGEPLDLGSADAVFRYVFSRLPSKVTIYPTGNFYYFHFPSPLGEIWGSLALHARDRDQGVLSFGYISKPEILPKQDVQSQGGGRDFSARDGVLVRKLGDFRYAVTVERKTVVFALNDVGLTPPRRAQLATGEIFVGPSVDESGLKFYLLFIESQSRLFWILNEDGPVHERFIPHSKDVIVGARTGLAFYVDGLHQRKILIGARAEHVLNNTWYDGPFDQTPENYVYTGRIRLQKYLEASYPEAAGRIDKYGYFTEMKAARVPVANYRVYYSSDELDFVEDCKRTKPSSPVFTACITQQIFNPPAPP